MVESKTLRISRSISSTYSPTTRCQLKRACLKSLLLIVGGILFAASVEGLTSASSNSSAAASGFDGPAELPRAYVKSSLSDTPSPGRTRVVKSGGDLQGAIEQAACGDIIHLEAAVTFVGKFVLPYKKCDDSHWITTRGIQLGGSQYVAVVDSFFTDFHCISKSGSCTDSQAISGGSGSNPMGPYKIVNNFLEAAGENILFGGGPGTVSPTDIEVRRNHMFRPMSWKLGEADFVGGKDGNAFIVKNVFELKNAQRVLLEGNILENTWGGFTQNGFAVVLTPKNQAPNVCPLCRVTDVTIRYNRIQHMASGFMFANILSDTGGASTDGGRYSIHDNIL